MVCGHTWIRCCACDMVCGVERKDTERRVVVYHGMLLPNMVWVENVTIYGLDVEVAETLAFDVGGGAENILHNISIS